MLEKTIFYRVNDTRFHVREEGDPKDQTALLIHGWSSSWYALSPLMPMLSERYHCIAVDLPGYGESPKMHTRATIAGYADLMADFVREISGDRPVVLVGHSMGGMISMTMALRHPDLVERMILLCPTVSGRLSMFINLFISPVTIMERFAVANWLVSALEPHFMTITDRLMRPASFAEQTGITGEDYHRLRSDARRPGQGRVRAECYWAMRDNDLTGKLAQIDKPALIVWGMEDNTVPLRDASIVATEWPDADLRVIPNAGHWPQFETPDVVLRYVRAFLGKPIKLLNLDF
jgi:pimeloyl-ACP methyl ester carboxylesterase